MSDDLEKIFDALGHRVRRRVIEELGKKGSATYTELMKAADVRDSGTFAFHLKKLQELGLVKKSSKGEYELTDLGKRAFSMIRMLKGEIEAYEVKPSVAEKEEVKIEKVKTISNAIRFIFTEDMARRYAEEGVKIRFQDIVKLYIEEMPRELLDKVLDSIENVTIVIAPEDLIDLVASRSSGVALIKSARGREIRLGKELASPRAGSERVEIYLADSLSKMMSKLASIGPRIASAIISTIPKFVESALAMERAFEGGYVEEYTLSLPEKFEKVIVNADSSCIRVSVSDKPIAIIRKRRKDSYAYIDLVDTDKLSVEADSVELELFLPKERFREFNIAIDSCILSLNSIVTEELVLKVDSSTVTIARSSVEKKLSLNADSSMIRGDLAINPMDRASMSISIDSATLQLDVSLPRDCRVAVETQYVDSSVVDIDVDGRKVGLVYRDPDYGDAKKKLEMKMSVDSSIVKVKMSRER